MERAARIHQYGPAEVLRVEAIDVPSPAPGDALVRHGAIGLNFIDVEFRRGAFSVPEFPAILGNEAVGIVEVIGPNVTTVKVGDRVAYANGPVGAYATARLYPADRLVRVPDTIADESVAASFLKGLTARCLLKEVVPLAPGDAVLFHAAAGGVGRLFTQWAASLDIRVIGTVSGEAKAAVARAMGCFAVIDYRREDFAARTLELTDGVGVAAAFDGVGHDTFLGSLATLRQRGTLVAFGKASKAPAPFDPFLLARRALHLTWPTLPAYTATPDQLRAAASDLFAAIEDGTLQVEPSRTYPLDEIVAAHRDFEGRQISGSAVIKP